MTVDRLLKEKEEAEEATNVYRVKVEETSKAYNEIKACRDRIARENVELQKELVALRLANMLMQNEKINNSRDT